MLKMSIVEALHYTKIHEKVLSGIVKGVFNSEVPIIERLHYTLDNRTRLALQNRCGEKSCV